MADEKKVEKMPKKSADKKPSIFVRAWGKIVKLTKDTIGELKKVVWTPKSEVIKSFKLVIATVLGISLVIAVIDLSARTLIDFIAGFI